MSTRADRERSTKQNERHQAILAEMLNDDSNKYCADCRSKGPRWASWNIGVFVCIRCAGIHRNLGVHISKMKSVNLDTWAPDQIECIRTKGNGIVNAVYEYSLPDSFRRPSDDSAVEAFIRSKYERKQYYKKQDKPAATPTNSGSKADKPKKESRKREAKAHKTTSTTVAAVPRPAAPGTPKATAKSTPATPDLLGGDFAAAPPRPASANDAMGAFMGSSSTPANPDVFGAAAPAQQAQAPQPSQPDLFANAPANAFAQPQAPPKEAKESILSLYGQGQPQMAMGMGAAVPNGMSAGQMAYQQQVYMQQQMQQQAMMQQQMAMQQQQMAMQQQAMQVNQVQSQMARLRMGPGGQPANGMPAANGWPAGGQMQQQQQPQQPQQPGQTMNTMLWN